MSFSLYKKVTRTKKIWILATISIILIALFIYILLQESLFSGESNIIATVNGDFIYSEEFMDKLSEQIIPVQQYFKDEYKIIADNNFGEGNFGGESPLRKAKELALNECIKIKVEQQLGREKGLIEDIDYPAFLKQLKKENGRRKKAIENKEVIYGPIEYQKNVYFEYLRSNMELQLKEILENEEIKVADEDIVKHYEKTKASLYRKEGAIKIIQVYLTYSEDEREAALKKIEHVKMKVDMKEKVENVLTSEIKYKEQLFNETTAKQDAQSNSKIKTLAESLAVGKTSHIIEENHTFYFIQCIEREADGYKSFEETKENVKVKYIDEKYEAFIAGLVDAAKVDINESVFDKIKME